MTTRRHAWLLGWSLLIGAAPGWAQEAPEVIWSATAHSSSVDGVSFSLDGQTLASGGGSGADAVRLWDALDGDPLASFPGQTSGVRSVTLLPDDLLAIGGIVPGDVYPSATSGRVDIRDIITGDLVDTFAGGLIGRSADGSRLASGGLGLSRNIAVHQTSDGQEIADIATGDYISALAYSPDGQIVAISLYEGDINLWDVETGTLLRTLFHGYRPFALAFSPDGQTLASGNLAFDGHSTIKFWRVSDGQLLHTIEGYDTFIGVVTFSPGGQVLLSTSTVSGFGRRIRLWRVSDYTLLETLDPGTPAAASAAFSPDGRRFAYGLSDGTVVVARNPLAAAGDADGDEDLDLADYAALVDCLAGPDTVPLPTTATASECLSVFDADDDADVDLGDAAAFQSAFTG